MAHPLLLPNILDNIFCNFSLLDLKLLRLVNLDWNHAACIAISKQNIIKFYSSIDLKSYQAIFNQSIVHPHTSFNFHYKIADMRDSQEVKNFFENFNFHEHIRSLSLTIGGDFLSFKDLMHVLRLVPNLEWLGIRFHYFKCPELEEENCVAEITPLLSLRCINIEVQSYDDCWNSTTNLICSIAKAAPHLAKIHHPMFCVPPTKCRITSQMNIYLTELVLEESLTSSLAYLNFIIKLNNDNIRTLMRKNYPLKNLYINMWYPDDEELCVTAKSLTDLLSQLSPTLEKLGLDFPWRREVAYEFKFQFPIKTLQYLSLSGFQGSLVGLLNKLPNLSSIELSQVDLFEILPASQIVRNYPTVCKLRLDFCIHQVAGAMSRLSRIFPNLRSLCLNHASDEICRMIFKKMLNLTYLRLRGDDLTDEGITGIPAEIAKENNLINCPMEKGVALRCFSFVGDLPKLRELKLEAYRLTEACIKHGIVHCMNLQFVSMDTTLDKNDPSTIVTRTFRLSEYGKKLLAGDKEVTLILQQEVEVDEDEDAEKFFRM
ncbi:uncharacterized protein LOC110863091 [Folsomia candida]|nr:uncharacterized protein LOC110863091 [Folsomia candida]XP_035702548.1 uncharacterized protein LOC110863091 [Folsomia candida]